MSVHEAPDWRRSPPGHCPDFGVPRRSVCLGNPGCAEALRVGGRNRRRICSTSKCVPLCRALRSSTTRREFLDAEPHELQSRLTLRRWHGWSDRGSWRRSEGPETAKAIWVNRFEVRSRPQASRNSRSYVLLRPAKTDVAGHRAQAAASEESNADTGTCGRGRASRRTSTPTGGTM